jgi:hypothetical protein
METLLSPFLFNVVIQCLAKMVMEAQDNHLLTVLIPSLIDKGVAIMQHVDDTVICITHDPEKATNLKLLLYLFKLMSRLKINYCKSEIYLIGVIISLLTLTLPCLSAKWALYL